MAWRVKDLPVAGQVRYEHSIVAHSMVVSVKKGGADDVEQTQITPQKLHFEKALCQRRGRTTRRQ